MLKGKMTEIKLNSAWQEPESNSTDDGGQLGKI